MNNHDKNISDFIDRLNAGEDPVRDNESEDSQEMERIYDTVRKVRSLKEPAMPDENYPEKLAYSISNQLKRKHRAKTKRLWIAGMASTAAVLAVALLLNFGSVIDNNNFTYAMEQAYQEVKAYHGIIEVTETNEAGESNLQGKLEVWADQEGNYYVKSLEGSNKGLVTINNGEQKWQIRPEEKQVHVFSAFPDAYRFILNLGEEVDEVKNALSVKAAGEDTIAGRSSTIIEVTPDGGLPYKIWIDNETRLPLQKQNAMQNSIQYTMTYSKIQFEEEIPDDIIAYKIPPEFTLINKNPEQIVNDLEEAIEAIGFNLKVNENLYDEYQLDKIGIVPDQRIVKLYYIMNEKSINNNKTQIILIQGKSSSQELKAAPTAITGKMGNIPVEIQSPVFEESGVLGGGGIYSGLTDLHSIRWYDSGYEFAAVGNVALTELISFTESLTDNKIEIAGDDTNLTKKPEIEVPVDHEMEANEQKSVDAGSSPWRLDPVFTAQVFVSLQISPEGITGDYPVVYDDFSIIKNTGSDAVVALKSNQTDIEKIYLKKIIRQDATGIWTVVGYDVYN